MTIIIIIIIIITTVPIEKLTDTSCHTWQFRSLFIYSSTKEIFSIQQTGGITSAKKIIVACLGFSILSIHYQSISDAGGESLIPGFRQKWRKHGESGKDTEVWFCNETAVQAKSQLSGKEKDIWFCNKTAVQTKFQLSRKDVEVWLN